MIDWSAAARAATSPPPHTPPRAIRRARGPPLNVDQRRERALPSAAEAHAAPPAIVARSYASARRAWWGVELLALGELARALHVRRPATPPRAVARPSPVSSAVVASPPSPSAAAAGAVRA